MSRTLHFHPGVVVDVFDIREYYETESEGLGERFFLSLKETYSVLEVHPLGYGRIWRNWRAILVAQFPFKIIFRVENQSVFIISVLHVRRHDRIWRARV